jgi:hypothetical protein
MKENRHLWRVWAKTLHGWGATEITASLLDSFGPLTILGAQALYLCQPFFKPDNSGLNLAAIASMLEDREEKEAFVAYLREGNPH